MNLNEILKKHEIWLRGEEGGERADLSYTDLSGVDLTGADLRYANLRCVDLRYANLRYANLSDVDLRKADLSNTDLINAGLRDANLRNTNLRCANLRNVNLRNTDLRNTDLRCVNLNDADLRGADLRDTRLINANLSGADLRDVNLRDADLRGTDLIGIKTNIYTIGYNLACPEKGSFIGYKKANGCIVELLILEDSKRSSATTVKCRCDKAKVLEIKDIETGEKVKEVYSDYDPKFIYKVGEIVSVDNFDNNRWNECASGIHFFMNRKNAINY